MPSLSLASPVALAASLIAAWFAAPSPANAGSAPGAARSDAAASTEGISLGINRWQPSVVSGGKCTQVVAFDLSAPDDVDLTDARIDLISEGVTLSSTPVSTTGESVATGPCVPDDRLRQITLSLFDATGAPLTSYTSPDYCRRDPQTPTPEAWAFIVGPGKPRPIWSCGIMPSSSGYRFLSGRTKVGFTGGTYYDARVVKTSGEFQYNEDHQPVAPTGRTALVLNGKQIASRSVANVFRAVKYKMRMRDLKPGDYTFEVRYLGDIRWEPLTITDGHFSVPRR